MFDPCLVQRTQKTILLHHVLMHLQWKKLYCSFNQNRFAFGENLYKQPANHLVQSECLSNPIITINKPGPNFLMNLCSRQNASEMYVEEYYLPQHTRVNSTLTKHRRCVSESQTSYKDLENFQISAGNILKRWSKIQNISINWLYMLVSWPNPQKLQVKYILLK